MDNEVVRKTLKDYLSEKGIKNRWIARKTNLSDASVSLFLRNERELSQDKLQLIWEIIKDN